MPSPEIANSVNLSHDPDPELLKVPGQIVVRYGQLEYILALTIKRASDMSFDDAMQITSGMLRRQSEAVRSFDTWAKDQRMESHFLNLINSAKHLCNRRNDIIHAFWTRDSDTDTDLWLRRGKPYTVNIDEIRRLRDGFESVIGKINHATRPDLVKIDPPHA